MRGALRQQAWLLACALLIAVALRGPLVAAHSRYFYHEDDAHHFNRTVEMAQRGELHPHYFNKPALHFYLRMPVVYASSAWMRLAGEAPGIQAIETRDPQGLAGYAFTASHPTVLAWNRAFSVIMSLGLVLVTFIIATMLEVPPVAAACAALLVAVSPEALVNSDIIGVDVPMALLCLAATALGIRALREPYARRWLLACGVSAGLAGATKYNAAPVALVPLAVALYRDRSIAGLLLAVAGPALGYAVGAPYSFLAFGEFWQGLSYEVWHYATGHEGHSATPGIQQALFYLSWLASDGIGAVAAALAVVGVVSMCARRSPALVVFLSFPAAYAALMVAQRTNFTRNMVAILPYAAVAAAYAIERLSRRLPAPHARSWALLVGSAAALALPALASLRITSSELSQPESREVLAAWLESRSRDGDVAIDGSLQIPPYFQREAGVQVVDLGRSSPARLVQRGFSVIVLPQDVAQRVALPFKVELSVPGNPVDKHAPRNPALSILRVTPDTLKAAEAAEPAVLAVAVRNGSLVPDCGATSEGHCWLQDRTTSITAPAGTASFSAEVMSPWPSQQLDITAADGAPLASLSLPNAGEWAALSVAIPQAPGGPAVNMALNVREIHSPQDRGLSDDPRRLGIAIRPAS